MRLAWANVSFFLNSIFNCKFAKNTWYKCKILAVFFQEIGLFCEAPIELKYFLPKAL